MDVYNLYVVIQSDFFAKMNVFWKIRVLIVYVAVMGWSSVEANGVHNRTVSFIKTNITHLSNHTLYKAGYKDLDNIEFIYISGAQYLTHINVEDLKLLPNLRNLAISQAPRLLRLDKLPSLPNLRTFLITNSGLQEVPNLNHVQDFAKRRERVLDVDLEGNHITKIPKHALRICSNHVSLNLNLIEEVPAHSFKNAQIAKLSFKGNTKLRHIDERAFEGILFLNELDLSDTAITHLPTLGLERLQVLKLDKTPSLKYIPSIYEFQKLERAVLTHHFHCCAFAFPEIHDPKRHAAYEAQIAISQKQCEEELKKQSMMEAARSRRSTEPGRETWGKKYEDSTEADVYTAATVESSSESEEYTELEGEGEWHEIISKNRNRGFSLPVNCSDLGVRQKVECTPVPDALNPCEDVMGWPWLRVSVWIVISAAVIGNVAVLLVLLTNHAELTVPRFLMCNLAFSDLCTGLYLFMLAVVDLRSFGEFFNYAYDWQYGIGCKIAGFFSVFSGQLSVFTLTIVTLERWFAITYAIYLERRINMATAAKIMLCGWTFAILLAGLPLVGVSDYSSTSICLPVESENVGDAVYQGSLFLTNAVAWVTIVICYVQIYRSLGGGGEKYGGRGAAAAAEKKIANKMALLVGTDLLCWAPVAFFGVTALAGVPLVDVSHGKVLLVFFYPLNACANPFLYAILTKQYRRDFISLLGRSGRCQWLVQKYKMAATPPPTAHTNPSAPAMLPLVERQRSMNSDVKENGEAMISDVKENGEAML